MHRAPALHPIRKQAVYEISCAELECAPTLCPLGHTFIHRLAGTYSPTLLDNEAEKPCTTRVSASICISLNKQCVINKVIGTSMDAVHAWLSGREVNCVCAAVRFVCCVYPHDRRPHGATALHCGETLYAGLGNC